MHVEIGIRIFTVYHTNYGIELHDRCDRFPNRLILGVFKSYEIAQAYGAIAANKRGVDFRNLAIA